jgi:hypothetical protein
MLWMYQRVMFGKLENPDNMNLKDLNLREIMTLVPIVIMCFWIGVYPKTWTSFLDASVANTVRITNPAAAAAEEAQMEALAAQAAGMEAGRQAVREEMPMHGADTTAEGHAMETGVQEQMQEHPGVPGHSEGH